MYETIASSQCMVHNTYAEAASYGLDVASPQEGTRLKSAKCVGNQVPWQIIAKQVNNDLYMFEIVETS